MSSTFKAASSPTKISALMLTVSISVLICNQIPTCLLEKGGNEMNIDEFSTTNIWIHRILLKAVENISNIEFFLIKMYDPDRDLKCQSHLNLENFHFFYKSNNSLHHK